MLKYAFILLAFFLMPPAAIAADSDRLVSEGNKLYEAEDYTAALERYKKAEELLPDSPLIKFDVGAALYKTKNYKEAVPAFTQSLASEDSRLEEGANYNLGNTKYRIGASRQEKDPEAAMSVMKESLKYYKRAIGLNPDDEDPKFNYEFVEKKLEELEKKQEKEKDENKEQDKEDKQDKQDKEDKEDQQDKQDKQDEKDKQDEQDKKD